MREMKCRTGCGACCIAPSIVNPLPGMPGGKPAGVMCVNLDPQSYSCRIWGTALYPDTCRRFAAERDICGENRDEALEILTLLEQETAPDQRPPSRSNPSE